MKWAFTIKQKSKAALILGVVFLLVLGKNWLDERNVEKLGDSFSSVYEDRLVAESYIYNLSDHLYQKKIMLDNCSNLDNNQVLTTNINKHNLAINGIITAHETTKLTPKESTYFLDFKNQVLAIQNMEKAFLKAGNVNTGNLKPEIDEKYAEAVSILHQLSGIQVAEGKLLNEHSKALVAGSSMLTQLELAVLIGIGLIIQGLIFAARSTKPKKEQYFSLN